jgi:hypothetical protein
MIGHGFKLEEIAPIVFPLFAGKCLILRHCVDRQFPGTEINYFIGGFLALHWYRMSRSKDLHLDGEIPLGVLAEILDEPGDLNRRLGETTVETVVREQQSGRPFAAFEPRGDDVQSRDQVARIVVQPFIRDQFAYRAFATLNPGQRAFEPR